MFCSGININDAASFTSFLNVPPYCESPTLLGHAKMVHRQTDPSVCVHVRFQCICCPYLTVPFDLYLCPAYRNAQGSVEEDPVALLQASHTATKPSKVWCALLLAHMKLVPSSPCSHRVLCCAVLWIISLSLSRCSALPWLHPLKRWWCHRLGCFLYTFFFLFVFVAVYFFPPQPHVFTKFAFTLW